MRDRRSNVSHINYHTSEMHVSVRATKKWERYMCYLFSANLNGFTRIMNPRRVERDYIARQSVLNL